MVNNAGVKAFTNIELLCVTGIILALSAILFPALLSAKEAAQKAKCLSNLKQVHLATTLYRMNYDGDGNYGTTYQMGLPPFPQTASIPELLDLRCSASPHPIDKIIGMTYISMYSEPSSPGLPPIWADYSQTHKGDSVLYVDPFHNRSDISIMNGEFLTRFMQGITVDGSIKRRSGKGNWQSRSWWHQ